ncbi:hypothetical protein TBLA_0C05420 [Henningerozyma blattae CBS 6284]|uniref:Copper transport protein n=1 Tax=Henningerozyma blattae (strain ATCC 34711 / CBS 6284 / DSM 70876 / NBRC 10599 / NRRL Y-10934 / UCD 77-7) TaxID=1071380 RepID=I2H1T8_HENB6|nr:hypothetical protein TBLA_0C05420 [Tetrapisispora blattae CBS 6284]CCH60340.1 hypothetical protein TBLA_0C05420 [Tetrapisispora blattae CBS 6284]
MDMGSMDMGSMDMGSMDMSSMSSMTSMIMSTMRTAMSMSSSSQMQMTMPMSSSSTTSMTMSMPMSMSSSSMNMGTHSMDMGSSMNMPMPMSMSMSMPMGSSMNMSGSGHGMMMGMDMEMNTYLTPRFRHYPVLFQHLSADTSGKAFGIWLLIVVTAFVYKLLLFTSWYLEIYWFKKWNKKNDERKNFVLNNDTENNYLNLNNIPDSPPNLFIDIFKPSFRTSTQDFIRCILGFAATMLIYMLMLVAMTFVLTYVFAVITGLSLSEVFFNKVKMALLKRWEIMKWIERKKLCTGHDNCPCCKDELPENQSPNSNVPKDEEDTLNPTQSNSSTTSNATDETPTDDSDQVIRNNEKNPDGVATGGSLHDRTDSNCACGCRNPCLDQSDENMGEIMQEQFNVQGEGNMDTTLLPTSNFRTVP